MGYSQKPLKDLLELYEINTKFCFQSSMRQSRTSLDYFTYWTWLFGLNTERYGVKRENMGQKNPEYEHLSCSVHISVSK